MDYEKIKKDANDILANLSSECSYIEYKASASQLAKILKTICAYGNNYYDNDIQYIFIGVEEVNDEKNKAIPKLPIVGIEEGKLEKCKNELNSLRSYLYPNVAFEILTNCFENRNYLLIVVRRQTGGPFMVSEKAEKDKRINLKPGRYVRVESDTRLARVDEEYDLLRKFANYHFSSLTNTDATIDDLNVDFIREYLAQTSNREIMDTLDKTQMAKSLGLLDKNDPTEKKVKNYAILMFGDKPEKYIEYSYVEMIVDMFGTKRKMEAKYFKGPIWKQYHTIVNYINDNYLNTIVVRCC
ncbi:MAG: putative DNA binding domain-containing protein [Blautia sp.]|nr:putative DNA binding domain-containing protein [Blautia sp.]